MVPRRIVAAFGLAAIGFLLNQCGSEEKPLQSPTIPTGSTVDTIPPAAITDLVAKNPTSGAVFLVWTAPGDDGDDGTADSYDIRYHDGTITEHNWDAAAQFDGEPAPKPAGQLETVRVDGLDPVTTCFFAVKTTDNEGYESGLSNAASATTLQENSAPADVPDLDAVAIDDNTYLLTWTAPGDDGYQGTACQYEIRYSQQPISASTWSSATVVSPLPIPKTGGEPESLLVDRFRPLESYYFALKAADEVPNWSGISNVAFGMGYSVYLELSDDSIQPGEELKIRFRAPGGDLVSILLNRYGVQGCDPSHPWVADSIEPGFRYTEGEHEISYDFSTPGGYLPRATYYVVLCWQQELKTVERVDFEDPPGVGP